MSSAPALLRTRGLTKRYPAVTAVDGLDVEVPAGRVGLVGANGAGKTTLFRMMLGVSHPTSGSLEVCGIDVAQDPIGVRSLLGYMPEHDCLPLDQTAADVVSTFGELSGLPPRAARQRASDVLDLVGLDEARFRPVGGFSTGMRQRTKLAQALVGRPRARAARRAHRRPRPARPRGDARPGGPARGPRDLRAARHPPARRRAAGVRPRDHARRRAAGRLRVHQRAARAHRGPHRRRRARPRRARVPPRRARPPGGRGHRAPWRCRSRATTTSTGCATPSPTSACRCTA